MSSTYGLESEAYKERQEKLRHLQKDACQLANYYFLFQAVIFTSIYSTPQSDVKCAYRWVPITLSSLAGFINLFLLVGYFSVYKRTLEDIDRIVVGNTGGGSYPIAMKLNITGKLICAWVCLALFAIFLCASVAGYHNITCAPPTAAS